MIRLRGSVSWFEAQWCLFSLHSELSVPYALDLTWPQTDDRFTSR